MAEIEPSATNDQLARDLVELHGRAALRVIRALIGQAERAGNHQAAETWREIRVIVRKELARIQGGDDSAL
jgi:hypothetical protein